ncbi:blr1970 [Bradyrhizobium diazoefficiens USDA 110]|uniref:Blr1970 protein n=3 Tax=Bradyrhizobium TaxID=374 RepID=H7C6J9_BRADU|nr:ID585 [Bradyrhizobium japonicum]AND87531.1 hypothetical protein AAV28_06720 [Bradyrhizobium diazoefficiens USDA 110]APO50601.1 hypothetical protein BD122_10120 [Bradyrhizobium diazoefficiens]AWL91404.1 hypothetical protein CIT37_03195 [Bradyrhizobium ottawaense]BAL13124.1 hypothetical protein BJ6T_78780 [Bradyrhizobium japonicum USDA 6]
MQPAKLIGRYGRTFWCVRGQTYGLPQQSLALSRKRHSYRKPSGMRIASLAWSLLTTRGVEATPRHRTSLRMARTCVVREVICDLEFLYGARQQLRLPLAVARIRRISIQR